MTDELIPPPEVAPHESEPPIRDPAEISTVVDALKKGDDSEIKTVIAGHIEAIARKHKMLSFKILLLMDERDNISHWHANRLYSAASSGDSKDILLLIHSNGGSIEPAYLISKTCMRLAKKKFIVAIPRRAKSAATLLSLGAHEIHMGLMSELGPIDPQFGGFPALGMQNALKLLADLSCRYPGSSEMWGRFLTEKLDLRMLGYFERVSESAIQYAERLLEGKPLPVGQTATSLANHFVNHYKDHGFVIDADESAKLLGDSIVKQNTNVYRFANEVHDALTLIAFFADFFAKLEFEYVGGIDDGMMLRKKREK